MSARKRTKIPVRMFIRSRHHTASEGILVRAVFWSNCSKVGRVPAAVAIIIQSDDLLVMKGASRAERMSTLDAPAVALGVFEGALHFFAENFGEDGAADGAGAGLGDVGRTVTAGEDALERLLDPICF